MVHLFGAHPVSDARELCEQLQETLHDTVRQCLDVPSISAEQWDIARLPIQAGGLYLPHLPSLAVIAPTAALAIWTTLAGDDLGVVLPHLPVSKIVCVFVLCDLVKTD